MTETGVIKGKLAYLSPEVVDTGTFDRRADIYELGVLLFEALMGKLPWLRVVSELDLSECSSPPSFGQRGRQLPPPRSRPSSAPCCCLIPTTAASPWRPSTTS